MKDTSYNFGAIRDSIMRLSASELIKESKSNTINSFSESIKKSSILKKQHLIYKNIQESKSFDKDRLAERFLNQNLQLFSNEKWHQIVEENKTLRRSLLDDFHVEAKKDEKLCESIHTLIESITNPNFQDHEKELDAYEFVISHLTRPVISESEQSDEKNDGPKFAGNVWKYVTKMAISNFNERFKHLNENEKKAFRILTSDMNTKTNYLETLRKENIEVIDKKIQAEKNPKNIDMLNEFKDKLESIKNISPSNIDEGIISCLELSEALK